MLSFVIKDLNGVELTNYARMIFRVIVKEAPKVSFGK